MATKSIDWNDGSGDKIYLTYPSASGDQTVQVTSDANRGAARATTVYFSTGEIYRQLIVEQKAALVPITDTLEVNPSSYDSDYACHNLDNPSRAYTSEDSTTYAQIGLTRGSAGAVTYVYFKFDTSAIPADATINSVSCKAKFLVSTTNANYIATRQIQMFSGTTPKGSATTVKSSATTAELSVGSWTRQELEDARIRMYATRGPNNVNNAQSMRLYGATLTVNYTYMGEMQ